MIWLSIDPGEDTGWALWRDNELIEAGQDSLWEVIDRLAENVGAMPVIVDANNLWQQIEKLVVEDWALYPWKVKELAWDKCRTARGIGAIELVARLANIQIEFQPAKIKEGAQAGGAKNLFLRPLHENRHANDAIMHGFWHIQRSKASAIGRNAEANSRAARLH